MTAKDIKSHIWITYQGAEGVMARMKATHAEIYACNHPVMFPILNTTEIGIEIQGDDLELVKQRYHEFDNEWRLAIKNKAGYKYRQALHYTPKQTPKADSEKKAQDCVGVKEDCTFPVCIKDGNCYIGSKTPTQEDIDWAKSKIPLSKVDNHIGETVEEACLAFQKKHDFRQSGLTELDFFKAGATYRTQHPDPAMVDRILEYVSHNISDIFMKADTLAGQKRVVKSMQDDILKELSK